MLESYYRSRSGKVSETSCLRCDGELHSLATYIQRNPTQLQSFIFPSSLDVSGGTIASLQLGTPGHVYGPWCPPDDARLDQRSREDPLGHRPGLVLDLDAALLHHARGARELHLSRAAPGGGVSSQDEAGPALAHPGEPRCGHVLVSRVWFRFHVVLCLRFCSALPPDCCFGRFMYRFGTRVYSEPSNRISLLTERATKVSLLPYVSLSRYRLNNISSCLSPLKVRIFAIGGEKRVPRVRFCFFLTHDARKLLKTEAKIA